MKDYFDQSLDEIKLLAYLGSRGDPDENHVLRMIDFFYYKEHLFIVTEVRLFFFVVVAVVVAVVVVVMCVCVCVCVCVYVCVCVCARERQYGGGYVFSSAVTEGKPLRVADDHFRPWPPAVLYNRSRPTDRAAAA